MPLRWRALVEPHVATGIVVPTGREVTGGELPQAVMQAVDHHDRGGRVGQGLSKSALGDVDELAEAVGRVVAVGALGREDDQSSDTLVNEPARVPVHPEQRCAGGHEVARHRDHLQHAVGVTGRRDQTGTVEVCHDSRLRSEHHVLRGWRG